MKSFSKIFALAIVTSLCISACGVDALEIKEHSWKVKKITGLSLSAEKLNTFTLEPGEGEKISGQSLCNEYRGGMIYNEKQIKFSTLHTDRKICDDYNQEKVFLSALESSTSYQYKGGTLVLFNDKGKITLELVKQ